MSLDDWMSCGQTWHWFLAYSCTFPFHHTSMHLQKPEEESTAAAHSFHIPHIGSLCDVAGWFSCHFSSFLWCCRLDLVGARRSSYYFKSEVVDSRFPTDHRWMQGGRSLHRSTYCQDGDLMKTLIKFHEILAQINGYLAGVARTVGDLSFLCETYTGPPVPHTDTRCDPWHIISWKICAPKGSGEAAEKPEGNPPPPPKFANGSQNCWVVANHNWICRMVFERGLSVKKKVWGKTLFGS